MFTGTYEPRMDAKGRVILPAKFRSQLEAGVVLTRGQEHCIYVFPSVEFDRMYTELQKASLNRPQARNYIRVMMSGADTLVPDRQGRVTLPPELRRYAGLGDELTVIGAGARAEIWNRKAWQEYLAQQEEVFANMAEEIIPGLL
ncbi:MAG: division/cell wall cluster transcriptional repressor MraZ [Varibaculum sp.]|nr:division/cell wall cluster transcriptional repressor MraZ [Varibaculum sp.]